MIICQYFLEKRLQQLNVTVITWIRRVMSVKLRELMGNLGSLIIVLWNKLKSM